jgi:SH3-like domain-containing protein
MHFRSSWIIPILLASIIIGPDVSAKTTSRAKTSKKSLASKPSVKTPAKQTDDTTKTAQTAQTSKPDTKSTTQKSAATKGKATTAKAAEDEATPKKGKTTTAKAADDKPTSDKSEQSDKTTSKTTKKSPVKEDSAQKAEPVTNIVVVKEVKTSLYAKPEKGKAQALLTKWDPLEVKGHNGDYVQVETDEGAAGYVSKSAVSESPYASIGGTQVNVRSGPSNDDQVLFSLKNHYPVQVVEKKGSRVHIKDYEGDNGWLHESLLSTTPYVIVNQKEINARVTPGADSSGKATGKIAFIAPKGVIFKLIETDAKTGWFHVKHEDGSEGWVSPKMVWGGAGR